MYSLIATWTILPGKEQQAVTALQRLAGQVQQTEPDTWGYTVHTPDFTQANLPTPPTGEVVFFEIYKDEAAFKAHVSGPTFTAFVKEHGALFLSNNGAPYVTVNFMKRHAGFIRA
jgi:quinol monooxygenase YgiN